MTSLSVHAFKTLHRELGNPVAVIDGRLFARIRERITPIGPALDDWRISRESEAALFRQLDGYWIQLTSPPADIEKAIWHAVICTKHCPVEEVTSANCRQKIRKGLRRCEIRQVSYEFLAEHGFGIFEKAIKRYRKQTLSPSDRTSFESEALTKHKFPNIREAWGAFFENKLVAYAQCIRYGNREIDYTAFKWDPDFLRHMSSYAMLYRMNEHYLGKQRVDYALDGFKSIYHETNFQDFLIHNFGFERAPLDLHVRYRKWLGTVLALARPISPFLRRVDRRANALFELDANRKR